MNDRIMNGIDSIDDSLIEEAMNYRRTRKPIYIAAGAAAAEQDSCSVQTICHILLRIIMLRWRTGEQHSQTSPIQAVTRNMAMMEK